jgi:hypothetical protein
MPKKHELVQAIGVNLTFTSYMFNKHSAAVQKISMKRMWSFFACYKSSLWTSTRMWDPAKTDRALYLTLAWRFWAPLLLREELRKWGKLQITLSYTSVGLRAHMGLDGNIIITGWRSWLNYSQSAVYFNSEEGSSAFIRNFTTHLLYRRVFQTITPQYEYLGRGILDCFRSFIELVHPATATTSPSYFHCVFTTRSVCRWLVVRYVNVEFLT